MTLNEYQKQAMVTRKGDSTDKENLINGCLGLAGETGEVCDIIKKHLRWDKPIDMLDLKKELGDVLWYLAELADHFGFTLDDVAETNIKKLAARHGGAFSGEGNRTGEGK
jgi:NTP pyrophosphatase (non-canonical NTP hydrolase)